jgi:hypothetical protein
MYAPVAMMASETATRLTSIAAVPARFALERATSMWIARVDTAGTACVLGVTTAFKMAMKRGSIAAFSMVTVRFVSASFVRRMMIVRAILAKMAIAALHPARFATSAFLRWVNACRFSSDWAIYSTLPIQAPSVMATMFATGRGNARLAPARRVRKAKSAPPALAPMANVLEVEAASLWHLRFGHAAKGYSDARRDGSNDLARGWRTRARLVRKDLGSLAAKRCSCRQIDTFGAVIRR